MMLPDRLRRALLRRARAVATSRPPDFVIGERERPYMLRWWILPRNPFFNVYLHRILRSDDDRALHDHPWSSCSIILEGFYIEHSIAAGGVEHRAFRAPRSVTFRRATAAHRLEVQGRPGECWSLFITGPRLREWGFHCPLAGWRHWKEFTSVTPDGRNAGTVGRGCE
jgi:hypothetical protein